MSRKERQRRDVAAAKKETSSKLVRRLLPVLIGLLRRNRGHATSATLCSAMVGAWAVGWGEGREMLVGYYVWCLSMMLALVAVPLRIQTLAMMFFLGALCAFVIFYWR